MQMQQLNVIKQGFETMNSALTYLINQKKEITMDPETQNC